MNRRLALALALPFLALGAQWLLWPWLKPFFWFLFFPAVFFSARLAGRRGGLPATVLSAVLVWYFFLPEPLSWGLKNPENLWSVGLFLAMGYLFSDAHERLRLVRRKTETDFEAVFEQAAVGMAHVSNEGRFLRVNHRFAEIVGRTPAAMTALHFQDITHPDDLPADLEAVRRLQAGEIASFTREKRFRRGEGEYIWARIHIALVRRPDGRPDYRIGVIEDMRVGSPRDNWTLSTERANTSREELVTAGVDENRIQRVVGLADRDPFVPADPKDPRNRRISITVMNQ